ncbi:MAG: ABC transporter substrate-binding protein, partial [Chloroflexi bacterium]|nr:ABC transporter substrate-binding protein [Chloroflexota bacterium]
MKRLATSIAALVVILFTLAQCAKPATTTTGTTTSTRPGTSTSAPPPVTSTAKPASTPVTSKQSTPAGPYGDLRYAVASFSMETWDPIKADGPNDSILLNQVYDWFFRMEAGKLAPSVIEKWDIAPDGLSWTFRVHQGIKFSDGTDLTAKDVKFSIDRYISKDALYANMRNAADRSEVVDNYTVRVYTKGSQPFLPFYMTDITPAQGIVTPADYITKNGVEYFMKNPMGSGPWKLTRYLPGDSVQYTAKDSNWRKVPAFKTLTISLVPEPATQVAMLKSGDIDVTGVSLEDAVNLEKLGYSAYPMVAGQSRLQFHGTLDPRAKGLP